MTSPGWYVLWGAGLFALGYLFAWLLDPRK